MAKKPPKGSDGFHAYYSDVYGERWPALREALLAPKKTVARVNAFVDHARDTLGHLQVAPWNLSVFESEAPIEAPTGEWPLPYFLMDGASILAALALGVREGHQVLDLCAAPGGKALILAEALAQGGTLIANDRSASRRGRLKRVLDAYLPTAQRERVKVTAHDATRWCLFETEVYDRILLDAPCSSERHVLHDPHALSQWGLSRIKQLAQRQYAMLASALLALKPGGRVVYATCALARPENDGIIEKLLKKKRGMAKIIPASAVLGEPTEHGWLVLPDTTGYGPIYFSIVERVCE